MPDVPAPVHEDKQTEPSAPAPAKPLIQRKHVFAASFVLLIALAALVFLVILAVNYPLHTETVRDIAIVALAAESGLIGVALIVLITQVARLANMLEYEIKPIIQNTADTVSTVRGTAAFMSEHMVSPVIKASSYTRGILRLAGAVGSLISIGSARSPAKPRADSESQPSEGGRQ